jgi:hypothetical protein
VGLPSAVIQLFSTPGAAANSIVVALRREPCPTKNKKLNDRTKNKINYEKTSKGFLGASLPEITESSVSRDREHILAPRDRVRATSNPVLWVESRKYFGTALWRRLLGPGSIPGADQLSGRAGFQRDSHPVRVEQSR